ncbi:MAG: hypothetical protein AB8G17_10660 [Gammaproteobacteria bacterium]
MNTPSKQASTEAPDWSALFFDPGNDLSGKFIARARKRYGNSPDAESAYNYALDRVSADNFAMLTERYAGKGSAAGFLSISFLNQMEEYARHKYPRARPPAWLKRLGDLWVRTWQMLCLQRQNPESIVDALGHNESDRRAEILAATAQIKARVPNCGQYVAEVTALDDEGPELTSEADDAPDQASERDTATVLLEVVSSLMSDASATPSAAQREALASVAKAVAMSDQERILLQLVYEQDHKIASAARAIGLERKQASRLHAALIARLRKALQPVGLVDR